MLPSSQPGPSFAINHPSLLEINQNLKTLVLKTNSYKNKPKINNIQTFRDLVTTNAPNLCELYFSGTIKGITDSEAIWDKNSTSSGTAVIPQLRLRKIGIELEYDREGFEPALGYNKGFLRDLFAASPFLESLILTSNYDSEDNEYAIFRVLVDAKKQQGNLNSINELQFAKANQNTINLIATQFSSSSLKKLIINETLRLDVETFTKILEDHKETLEHLKFIFHSGYQQLIFPNAFEKLTKLEFGAKHGSNPEPFFVGGTIQGDTFPNLVTLNLIDEIVHFCRPHSPPGTGLFDLEELFPEDGKPIPTLRNLSLPPIISVEGLRRAGTIFPGVKKLCLGPQRLQVIGELWNIWTETLEILTISLDSETFLDRSKDERSYDSMITGLPDTFIQEIKENLRMDGQIPNLKISTFFPNRASIANLKKLSHVHFHNGPRLGTWTSWSPPSKFTDISFHLGFGQLKSLEVLVMPEQAVEVSVDLINEICGIRSLRQVKTGMNLSLAKSDSQAKHLQTGFGLLSPFESLNPT